MWAICQWRLQFRNRLQYTWYQTMDFVQLVWFSLCQLVSGNAGINDLSGPVGIVTTIKDVGTEAQESAEANNRNGLLAAAESIAYFAALIAVNLAVMNLLPLPALDGGRIFSCWWTPFPWRCSSRRSRKVSGSHQHGGLCPADGLHAAGNIP